MAAATATLALWCALVVGVAAGSPRQLAPRALRPLPLGALRGAPQGWMRDQLGAQRDGLCGNRWLGAGGHVSDSSWLGGRGYNGLAESYPYWLNGAVPLSVLLGDAAGNLTADISSQVRGVLRRQQAQAGWLGPLVNGSEWSAFRFSTALAQYAEAVDGDESEAVADALWLWTRALRDRIAAAPIANGSWTQSRWQEMVAAVQWLLDAHRGDATPQQLNDAWSAMELLQQQGFNWTKWVASDEQHPFLPPPAPVKPTPYLEGQDMMYNDIRMQPMPPTDTHVDCERLCNATSGCVAYVWGPAGCGGLPSGNNSCWLKSATNSLTPNACRNTRVVGGGATIRPWFPTDMETADLMGTNAWLPQGINRQWTHGVNLAQGMAAWHLMYRSTGDESWLSVGRAAWEKVMRYHGQASGVFTGDETLAGLAPERGTETCTVVETMYSLGEMWLTTGDLWYADRLERVALNALPAAFSNGTMWSLNYFQQGNKLDAMDGEPACEKGCTYCFGMVYECCVSNHVQGWPKFVARQLATAAKGTTIAGHALTQDGLVVSQYFASRPKTFAVGSSGNDVTVAIDTEYPWNEVINITVSATSPFPLLLRIPGWCEGATVTGDGVAGTLRPANGSLALVNVAAGSSALQLTLPMVVRVERRPAYRLTPNTTVAANAANVLYGPLLFAAPRQFVQDHDVPYDDGPALLPRGQPHGQNNYLLGTGPWQFALHVSNDTDAARDFTVVRRNAPVPPAGQGPFAAALAPLALTAAAKYVGDQWGVVPTGRGAAQQCDAGTTSIANYTTAWANYPPTSPVAPPGGKELTLTLLPFGATDLRVSEFPTYT